MIKENTWLILTLVNLKVPANALCHWRAWHGTFHIYPITLFSQQGPPANCLSLYRASSQTLPKNRQENSCWPRLKSLQRLFLHFNSICAYYWMSIFPSSKLVMSYHQVFRIGFDTLDVRSQICLKLFCLFVLLVFENLLKIKTLRHRCFLETRLMYKNNYKEGYSHNFCPVPVQVSDSAANELIDNIFLM